MSGRCARRAAYSELRQREAAVARERRAADPAARERDTTSKRRRRAENDDVRERDAAAKRQRLESDPGLRQQEVARPIGNARHFRFFFSVYGVIPYLGGAAVTQR